MLQVTLEDNNIVSLFIEAMQSSDLLQLTAIAS